MTELEPKGSLQIFEELTFREAEGAVLAADSLTPIFKHFTDEEEAKELKQRLREVAIPAEDQNEMIGDQNRFLSGIGISLHDVGMGLWDKFKVADSLLSLSLVATNKPKANWALYWTIRKSLGEEGLTAQLFPTSMEDFDRSVLGIMANLAEVKPEDLGIESLPVAEPKAVPAKEPEAPPAAVEEPAPGKEFKPTPIEEKGICERLNIDPAILRLAKGETRDLLKPPTSRFWSEEERGQMVVMVGYHKEDLFHYLNPRRGSVWALTSILKKAEGRREDYEWTEIKEGKFLPIIKDDVGETVVNIGGKLFLITEVVDGASRGRLELTPVKLGPNAPPMPEVTVEAVPAEAKKEEVPPAEEVKLESFSVEGDGGNLVTAMLRRKGLFGASRAEVGDLQAVLGLITHRGTRTKLTVSKGELLLIEKGKAPQAISGVEKDAYLTLSLKDVGKTRIQIEGCKADVVYMGIENGKALFTPVPREAAAETPTAEAEEPPSEAGEEETSK